MTGPPQPPARSGSTLRRALLADGRLADVRIADGTVTSVEPAAPVGTPLDPRVDLDLHGALLLPAFVEPHAHLDKALVGPLDAAPGLPGAIDAWRRHATERTVAETVGRAGDALTEYVRHGTGAVRTHVDVDERLAAAAVAGVAALRDRFADAVDLEIVAMPATPLTGRPASGTRDRLVDALDAGADVVGGAPWVDPDPRAALDLLLDVAADRGTGVDLHVDETLSAAVRTVGHLVAAVDRGFPGAVTAGHLVSLGQLPDADRRRTAEDLARTGIRVVTNPRSNLWLQGRTAATRARRGLTAVRTLLDAGVEVAAGGDNLRDPFSPYGAADPLQIAQLLALAADVTPHEALLAVTGGAPGSPVRLTPAIGDVANLVALRARDAADAVARVEGSRVVLHRGLVVARRQVLDDPDPRRFLSAR